MFVVSAVTMSALVVLSSCLPGHGKPSGDLRPSDAQADGMVDQHREFRLCLVSRETGMLDPLEYLGRGQPGNPLHQACRFRCRVVRQPWLHALDSRTRPTLRLGHGIQHVGQVRQSGCRSPAGPGIRRRPGLGGLQVAVHGAAAVTDIDDHDPGLVVLHAVDHPPRADADPQQSTATVRALTWAGVGSSARSSRDWRMRLRMAGSRALYCLPARAVSSTW